MPYGLVARIEQDTGGDRHECRRVRLHRDPEPQSLARRNLSEAGCTTTVTEEVTATEPTLVLCDTPPARHIAIRDHSFRGELVTVIEVLRPIDKLPFRGIAEYLARQRACLQRDANLVEIDLFRGGEFVLGVPQESVPPSKRDPYLICVNYAPQPGAIDVYAATLRERLPTIRIPLRVSDRDITLDVQAMIDLCCERGAYGASDYSRKLDPPVGDDDAKWAEDLLRKHGLIEA